jgi:hypothetical protein
MVNVDTVYQRVLALANKEQRGYVTPQEFNLFANMAQLEIFEQYFYDLDQWRRKPGNDTLYADRVSRLEDKIEIFLDVAGPGIITGTWGTAGFNPTVITIPSFVHTIKRVELSPDAIITPYVYCDRVNNEDFNNIASTSRSLPLFKATQNSPVFNVRKNQLRINNGVVGTGPSASGAVNPLINNISVFYIRKPKDVIWGHVVIKQGGGKALYNANTTQHFEVHMEEETELVYKILKFAGSAMKREDLQRGGAAEENKLVQQQKQ